MDHDADDVRTRLAQTLRIGERIDVFDVLATAVSVTVHDIDIPEPAIADVAAWFRQVDATRQRSEASAPDGALAVARALEHAAEILEQHGCSDFSITAAGDTLVRGAPRSGGPWRIAIRDPRVPDDVAIVVDARGRLAVATCAPTGRSPQGATPRSRPSTRLASATVVGPDLTVAVADAQKVCEMGLDGIGWIGSRPDYDCFVIDVDGMTSWTDGFLRYGSVDTFGARRE